MRPLHKVCSNDPVKPAMAYIRVVRGEIWTTNEAVGLITPVSEIFPDNLIADDEELYFVAKEWQSCKMDKAVYIERDGVMFTAKDRKHNVIGRIKALMPEHFEWKYPDLPCAYPDEQGVINGAELLSLNPVVLDDLIRAMGEESHRVYLTIFNAGRAILVKSVEDDCKAVGVIMPHLTKEVLEHEKARRKAAEEETKPVDTSDADKLKKEIASLKDELDEKLDEIKKLKDALQESDNEVKELEKQVEAKEDLDSEEYEELQSFRENVEENELKGIEPIHWHSNYLLDSQLMESFGELLGQGRPLDLLRRLEALKDPAVAKELDLVIELQEMLQ